MMIDNTPGHIIKTRCTRAWIPIAARTQGFTLYARNMLCAVVGSVSIAAFAFMVVVATTTEQQQNEGKNEEIAS